MKNNKNTAQDPYNLSKLTRIHTGKTRDSYQLKKPGRRLIVATDRVSTHDLVHKSLVPHKGEVLTALTVFFIQQILTKAQIRHHLVACGRRIYDYLPGSQYEYPRDLHLRAIVVKELDMIPVEFIFRSRVGGSLYKKFYSKGLDNPYGVILPPGLQLMSEFHSPVFTPTEKSATDDPLNSEMVQNEYPAAFETSDKVFKLTRKFLHTKGIELLDCKFENGVDPKTGEVCVGDEIATPDCSRFCELGDINLGHEPRHLDKQVIRDKAELIWNGGEKYPIEFEPAIIDNLSKTYLDIFERITDSTLEKFQHKFLD